jgi:hypothetical protein
MGAGDLRAVHHVADLPPCRGPAPCPKVNAFSAIRALLQPADIVDQVQGVEKRGRDGNSPLNSSAAFLQALKNDDAVFQVHAIGGEFERLRDPAAGIGEHRAKHPYMPIFRIVGRFEKGFPLSRSQVLPMTLAVVQAHSVQRIVHAMLRDPGFAHLKQNT